MLTTSQFTTNNIIMTPVLSSNTIIFTPCLITTQVVPFFLKSQTSRGGKWANWVQSQKIIFKGGIEGCKDFLNIYF